MNEEIEIFWSCETCHLEELSYGFLIDHLKNDHSEIALESTKARGELVCHLDFSGGYTSVYKYTVGDLVFHKSVTATRGRK